MANDLNRVFILGRLTRDPETRQLPTGATLCRFSIANNRSYTQNNEKKEEVSYFNCIAWGKLGEIIQKYCQKGKQVAIEGRLRQNSWQDTEGKKVSSVEINVENLQLLGGNNGGPSINGGGNFQSSSEIPQVNSQDMAYVASLPTPMEDDDIPF